MTFVNLSLFLGGTAFVALPIVLHLIMRQRPKRLEFPALRFVRKKHDANRRKLRLRHILLLLLRAAAVGLLALALARPTVDFAGSLGSQEAPVAAALVFDAAPRMDYRHDNRSRLQLAQELGAWLAAQLPQESQIAVLDTRPGRAAFQIDAAAAKQRIERLETVANSQPLTGPIDEAFRLLDTSELTHWEIYAFTDLSLSAWPSEAVARMRERIEELSRRTARAIDLDVYLIDVGVENPTNYALGQIRLSGQVLSSRSALKLETELLRIGPGGKRTVELHMLDETGNLRKRRGQSYTLEADESRRVEFFVGGLGPGTHQGILRVLGEDGLAADNSRYFTVEVKPPWQVLVVAPQPASRYALYLREALAPAVFRKRGQARFDCRVLPVGELLKHPLDDYAAVCLLDPTPLQPAVWKKLHVYAAGGRGVAVFLGRKASRADSFNAPMAQKLLPGKLLGQVDTPDGDVCLWPGSGGHPALAGLRRIAGSVPWRAFPVFRFWRCEDLHEDVSVVLPYNDEYGRPAVLERPLGEGRVLTMTTPISDDPNREPWNLLPIGDAWPFGMLANGMLLYLVGSSDQQLNYFAGLTAELQLQPGRRDAAYTLFAPDGSTLPLTADLAEQILRYSSTDQVGNYRVKAGGETVVDRGFSVNLAPPQTRLDRIPKQELSEMLPYQVARTRDQIERNISTARVGRELFPLLILLMAMALAAEHVVANRFYRE